LSLLSFFSFFSSFPFFFCRRSGVRSQEGVDEIRQPILGVGADTPLLFFFGFLPLPFLFYLGRYLPRGGEEMEDGRTVVMNLLFLFPFLLCSFFPPSSLEDTMSIEGDVVVYCPPLFFFFYRPSSRCALSRRIVESRMSKGVAVFLLPFFFDRVSFSFLLPSRWQGSAGRTTEDGIRPSSALPLLSSFFSSMFFSLFSEVIGHVRTGQAPPFSFFFIFPPASWR